MQNDDVRIELRADREGQSIVVFTERTRVADVAQRRWATRDIELTDTKVPRGLRAAQTGIKSGGNRIAPNKYQWTTPAFDTGVREARSAVLGFEETCTEPPVFCQIDHRMRKLSDVGSHRFRDADNKSVGPDHNKADAGGGRHKGSKRRNLDPTGRAEANRFLDQLVRQPCQNDAGDNAGKN